MRSGPVSCSCSSSLTHFSLKPADRLSCLLSPSSETWDWIHKCPDCVLFFFWGHIKLQVCGITYNRKALKTWNGTTDEALPCSAAWCHCVISAGPCWLVVPSWWFPHDCRRCEVKHSIHNTELHIPVIIVRYPNKNMLIRHLPNLPKLRWISVTLPGVDCSISRTTQNLQHNLFSFSYFFHTELNDMCQHALDN